MKTLIKILLILILLTPIAYSQSDIGTKYYEGGVVYYSYFSDVDSTLTYYSKWFDATMLDNSNPILSCYYYTIGGNSDTIIVIIQGAIPFEYGYLTYNLDTVSVVGDNSYDISSSAVKLAVLKTAPTTLTVNSKYLPMWRFVIKQKDGQVENNRNDGKVAVAVYAPTVDYIPERTGIGNIK